MDRLRLKQYLEAAGVAEDRYLLVGLDPPRPVREGACIVRPNQHSWEVLVWEPARLAASLTFVNEDQACGYALDVLTPAGAWQPAPVAEAAEVTHVPEVVEIGDVADVAEVAPAVLRPALGTTPLKV
jgi:hypothetical protein